VDYVGPQARARLQLGQDYKVEASDDLLYRLQHEFGDDNVEVVYESA